MQEIKDRRIRKTKQAVHQALLTLMEDKPLSDITVIELTQLADINRKTFYNHYDDIYAVLDEMEDDCVDHVIALLSSSDYGEYVKHPASFFTRLIEELNENESFYTLLTQSQSHSHITQKLISREKELLRNILGPAHFNEIWADYFLNFISAGTTSVINSWFSSGRQVSAETLADFFGILFTSGDVRRFVEVVQLTD